MTTHTSTAAAVLSRRTLPRNGAAMAAHAAFSPVTAAAMRTGTTREKETTMQTATTRLKTTQRAAADAIRPFHIPVSEEALTNLRRLAAPRWPDRYEGLDRSLRLMYSPSCLCLSHRVHRIHIEGARWSSRRGNNQYCGRMHHITGVAVARAGTIIQVSRAFSPECAHRRTKPFTPVSLDTLLRHFAVSPYVPCGLAC